MLTQPDGTRLDKTLETIRTKKYLDEGLVELIENVAHMQLAARLKVDVVLPEQAALASTSEVLQGKPLLPLHHFPIDSTQAQALFCELADMLGSQQGQLAAAAQTLAKAVTSEDLDLGEAFARFLEGNTAFFEKWAKRFPDTPRALDFLVQSALTPSLEVVAQELADRLPSGTRSTGSCPICGGMPFISSLRGKKGKRFATCSMCRHEYPVRRLACPYCDEDDATKLKFFTAKEEPGYRVDTCDSCGLYIKTVDFREMDRHEIPALDDLDSLALDFVADQEGFRRATLSAWGF